MVAVENGAYTKEQGAYIDSASVPWAVGSGESEKTQLPQSCKDPH